MKEHTCQDEAGKKAALDAQPPYITPIAAHQAESLAYSHLCHLIDIQD